MSLGWEIPGILYIADGSLQIDGVSASELASRFGTPLFVFSADRIRHNIERISAARATLPCPLKVCYAAKANSTMAILATVRDAGCDLEVNSGGELWKALEIGFAGDRIVFNGTSKEAWEIEMAINAEIYAIQADSLYELSLISDVATRLNKPANVSLRLVPEIETDTHSGLQTALRTSKFGMMPDEALSAFSGSGELPYLNICGVHLHIGSQNPDPRVYSEALAVLSKFVDEATKAGAKLRHINIGGGFPVNYMNGGPTSGSFASDQNELLSSDFDPAEALTTAWKSLPPAAAAGLTGLTLLVEPGRSIIADAGICLATVRNKKVRAIDDGAVDEWLLTDAGFNLLLSMETYKWYYHIVSSDRAAEPHDTPYKIAGPLCDGGDVYFDIEGEMRLPDHRMLPTFVQPGEVIALLNCGAYTLSQASEYNGRALPAVVLIDADGTVKLIRDRDRLSDLVRRDIY
jgi:diaminopimelate decarboxylase